MPTAAKLITSDVDERDRPVHQPTERTPEGFFRTQANVAWTQAIARGLAYAPYADSRLVRDLDTPTWTRHEASPRPSTPSSSRARCWPTTARPVSIGEKQPRQRDTIAKFQRELGAMGYKFQFVTLAGFHALNYSMFELARGYRESGMSAYAQLQADEFAAEERGYSAVRHQREVGTGYFDQVTQAITGGQASTLAMSESTEAAQFDAA